MPPKRLGLRKNMMPCSRRLYGTDKKAFTSWEVKSAYTYLTVEMIEKYLRMATFGDVEDINFRKSLVNTYIREIIYYPDKIIITMNFTDTYDKHDITPESVEEIEKQSTSEAAFQKDMSSYSLTFSPP